MRIIHTNFILTKNDHSKVEFKAGDILPTEHEGHWYAQAHSRELEEPAKEEAPTEEEVSDEETSEEESSEESSEEEAPTRRKRKNR